MRTDAIIDRRQVKCPNASTIGYGKYRAQVGDLILFREGERTRLGRMIGRVHYAPALTGDRSPVRDWILALCIGDMLNHTFERWINPVEVVQVESIRNQGEVIAYFLSGDLKTSPVDEIRRCAEYGCSTIGKYREIMAQRARDLADFEKRHPKGVCQCKLCALSNAETPEQATIAADEYLKSPEGDQGNQGEGE